MRNLRIVCCVKQTFSTDARIRLDAEGRISQERVKNVVNPYDEFTVEEALRIKERHGAQVKILSIGPPAADEAIRQCLAMGADRGTRVDDGGLPDRDEAVTAEILAAALRRMEYDLVLCGKTSADSNAAEVPIRLAEALNLPQAGAVSRVELEDGKLRARSEGDGVAVVLELPLPALLTAEKSLNMPRYPTLPNLLKAKRAPIETLTLADVGLSPAGEWPRPTRRRVAVTLPPPRAAVRIIAGPPRAAASELARLLREEAKAV